MATPFLQAWDILKYFKNPHDEEKDSFRDKYPDYDMKGLFDNRKRMPTEKGTYGGISSNMDNPLALARVPGFHRDTRNERERLLDDTTLPDMPQSSRRTMMGGAELDTSTPPNPFLAREPEPEVDPMVEALEELSRKRREEKDVSPLTTIPMSPRGSVRGMGQRQAFDKPKKPEWWRGNQ